VIIKANKNTVNALIEAQYLFEAQSLIEAHPTRGSENKGTVSN